MTIDRKMANPSIQIMYSVCVLSVLFSLWVLIRRRLPIKRGLALLFAALVPTVIFAWLNLSGTLCERTVENYGMDCRPLFPRDDPLAALVYDAAEWLGWPIE